MHNANVIVTGASGEIGSSIALKFAEKGCNLGLIGHTNSAKLNSTIKEIDDNYVLEYRVISKECDLADYESTSKAINDIISELGDIDILVNCAGMSYVGLLSDMSIDEWKRVIDTNLTSVYNVSKIVSKNMINHQSGKIINISSVWGQHGASMEVAYSASKGAVDSFTKALAKELAPSNIAVNAVSPGFIDTKMNSHLTAEEISFIIDEIPADRLGTASEVADLVYMVSEMSTYMTGQIITIDGGWTL